MHKRFADSCGYPVMLEGAARRRRPRYAYRSTKPEDLIAEFNSATNEAKKAFGNGDIFIEKYLESAQSILKFR